MKRYPSFILLFVIFATTAWSGDKEDVAAATQKWAEVFVLDDPDSILALYAKDGVLWGTLSPTRRDDPAGLRDYFVKAYAALPKFKNCHANSRFEV